MKIKQITLLMIIGLLIFIISKPHSGAKAQAVISENLFTNPGFEQGYYNKNDIPQIAVPNGWDIQWLDNVPFFGTEDLPAYRPETVVWNIQDAPLNERDLFFRDGSFALKIFKNHAPMYAALSQSVSGLQVGRNYRITVPVFVDMVSSYDGGAKQPPYRSNSGFIRFGAGSVGAAWLNEEQINYSPYWTSETVSPFYLATQTYIWDFTASATDMTIFIEVGSRHPYQNNGFFMDGLGLFALETTGVVSPGGGGGGSPSVGPTLTPFPTQVPRADGAVVHVVQGGDSMWTIAIQYAPTLGVTPEEALPLIQELNNNPAFISAGQELVIVPAGEAPPVEEAPTEEPAEEETTEEDETAEATEEVAAVNTSAEEVASEEVVSESAATTSNSVCVSVFNDADSNGQQDSGSESLQANAAITLFRAGATVSTYITDGLNEPYCFENLDPDTYQVQVFPPADFAPTTADTWAVSVSNGAALGVAFGVKEGVAEVAEVVEETAVTSTDTPAEETEATPEEESGFFSNVGGIVIGAGVLLLLLAGVGVAMLRRG